MVKLINGSSSTPQVLYALGEYKKHKKKSHLSYRANAIIIDVLATQGARASAYMELV